MPGLARVPAIVSGLALPAGLAGACLTGVAPAALWRMFLAFSLGFAFSEVLFAVDSERLGQDGDQRLGTLVAQITAWFGIRLDPARAFRWLERGIRLTLEFCLFVLTGVFFGRIAAAASLPAWVCAAWFVGCVKVPWCYRGDTPERRFRSWVFFLAAAATGTAWLALGRVNPGWAGLAALGMFAANGVGGVLAGRRRA